MERYAVLATEEKIKEVWKERLFGVKTLSLKEALYADMDCRLQGTPFSSGDGAFEEAAILFPMKGCFREKEFCKTFGGDAVRLGLLLEKELSSETLFPKWRFVNTLWEKIKENKESPALNVITKYFPKTYLEAQISEDLNKKDFYHAFCGIKSLLKTETSVSPFFLYPFVPFLMLFFYPEIHSAMPVFYQQVIKGAQNPFVKVFYNGKLCGYVLKKEKELMIKEALSLERLRGKIPQRVIFSKERILNVLD